MTPTDRDMQAADMPHDFIDPASDGYEFHMNDDNEYDPDEFRWVFGWMPIGVVFVGVIIGIAIVAGIIIGALT